MNAMQIGCWIPSSIMLLAATGGCGQSQSAAPAPALGNQPSAAQVSNDQVPPRQDDVVEIPLNHIWGYNMPGTRQLNADRHGLKGDYVSAAGPQLREITRLLQLNSERDQAGPGFVVSGTGSDALREVRAILDHTQNPQRVLTSNNDISLFFFSLPYGAYVHLHDVRRWGNSIDVRYRFVPHFERDITAHFALIPLTDLPVGEFVVRFIRSPMEKQFGEWEPAPISKDDESRIICKSFSFLVVKSNEE
jgi:hypothetical protein